MENKKEREQEKVTVADVTGKENQVDPGAQAYLEERNALMKALSEKHGYFEKIHLSVTPEGIVPAISIFKAQEDGDGSEG